MASLWAANMDKGELTGLVFQDLHKTFDMVNQDVLLQKHVLCSLIENGIKSYLSDRFQMVQFPQAMSESMSVTSVIPQGSILEHLLFIIFMNDLPLEIENYNVDMYTDDNILEINSKTVGTITAEAGFGHG